MAKIKHKHKRPKTRLWHVYLRPYETLVSKNDIMCSYYEYRKVRACTAKAAGRRIVRNNLATAMAGNDYETDNPNGPDYHEMDLKWAKRYKHLVNQTKIKVIKQ